MSHNLIKLATGISLVAIPVFLFKDQIISTLKGISNFVSTDFNNSMIYAQDRLGASGGISTGDNSEIF